MAAIELAGKPIAITGASSGIGAATALACARAGMPVALGARRADKLAEIVKRVTDAGGRAIAVTMDVRSESDNRRLIDDTIAAFGSVYAVYANAGYGEDAAFTEMTDAQMRDIWETNFFGTLHTIRAALPHLLKNPETPSGVRGHVLICSSCLAKMSLPFGGAYSATKAAQNHIGRAMNIELRSQGVRVSTVHPIGTATEFFDQVKRRCGERPTRSVHTHPIVMQSAEVVAGKTVACLRRPRPEVWTGAKGVLVRTGMAAAAMFPSFSERAVRAIVGKCE